MALIRSNAIAILTQAKPLLVIIANHLSNPLACELLTLFASTLNQFINRGPPLSIQLQSNRFWLMSQHVAEKLANFYGFLVHTHRLQLASPAFLMNR